MDLETVYRQTNYVVDEYPTNFVIRLGGSNADLNNFLRHRSVRTWAFLTAHNPQSQPLSDDENAIRQAELIATLIEHGYSYLTGRGIGDDPAWDPEPSLMILDIDREAAINIGKRFRQNAILWGKIDEPPELIWCL